MSKFNVGDIVTAKSIDYVGIIKRVKSYNSYRVSLLPELCNHYTNQSQTAGFFDSQLELYFPTTNNKKLVESVDPRTGFTEFTVETIESPICTTDIFGMTTTSLAIGSNIIAIQRKPIIPFDHIVIKDSVHRIFHKVKLDNNKSGYTPTLALFCGFVEDYC